MSAQLLLGVAIGMIVAFFALSVLVMIARSRPKAERQNLDDANGLLRDRNTIGEIQSIHLNHISDGIRNLNVPLRDEFAKSALEGYLTGWENPERVFHDGHQHHANVAQACYRYADAMLAERGKEEA